MRDANKNTILGVRFTKGERERIAKIAQRIHPELKPSSWVRHVAIRALEEDQARKAG